MKKPVQTYFVRFTIRYCNGRTERHGLTSFARNAADAADFVKYRCSRFHERAPAFENLTVEKLEPTMAETRVTNGQIAVPVIPGHA